MWASAHHNVSLPHSGHRYNKSRRIVNNFMADLWPVLGCFHDIGWLESSPYSQCPRELRYFLLLYSWRPCIYIVKLSRKNKKQQTIKSWLCTSPTISDQFLVDFNDILFVSWINLMEALSRNQFSFDRNPINWTKCAVRDTWPTPPPSPIVCQERNIRISYMYFQ